MKCKIITNTVNMEYGEYEYLKETCEKLIGGVFPGPGLIRWREIIDANVDDGPDIKYEFSILRRPYFFNLIGKKKWENSIVTNDFNVGMSFSQHLLK
jgi:hypothetical protein